MADAWRSLGAQVTLIEGSDRPLEHEERFAGELVQEALRVKGVDVRCDATATAVHRNGDDEVVVSIEGGPDVVADELLVATGRVPHTDDLGVDTVGLEPGEYIDVDDQMRAHGRRR